MELADNLTDNQRQGLVITGNGKFDIRFLRLIMRVMNGEKPFLASPTLPLSPREGRVTGLDGLSIIGRVLDEFRIRACLFCIDREHVEDIDAVKRALNKYGFKVKEFKELESRTYEIDAYKGSKAIRIFLVIFGCEKSIEEDIAELARIRGYSLPNYRIATIKEELLPKIKREDIKKAFKHLYVALTQLKKFLKS